MKYRLTDTSKERHNYTTQNYPFQHLFSPLSLQWQNMNLLWQKVIPDGAKSWSENIFNQNITLQAILFQEKCPG